MDPLDAVGGMGIAGAAIAALSFAVRELAKRRNGGDTSSAAPRSKSGELRAIREELLREEREKAMLSELHTVYEIVRQRDPDGIPRVHNKPSVEQAILESRELDRRVVELLEQQERTLEEIRDALRGRPDPNAGRYRMTGGGE